MKHKTKVIFMGTPDFGLPALEKIHRVKNLEATAVFTRPDKPVGRKQQIIPSPIKKFSLENKIPVFQPEKIREQEWIDKIKRIKPALIIVAAYGQILPKEILEIPKYGSLNIHASLLPKYRGASPIQYAILKGEKETGITIILMNEKMDEGTIVSQAKIKIEKGETASSLHNRLSWLGGTLLIETLPKWIGGKIIPLSQTGKPSYTKILKKDDGKINWHHSSSQIERKIRAFEGWPGTSAKVESKKEKGKSLSEKNLKILKAKIGDSKRKLNYPAGKIFLDQNKNLAVKCGKGYLIIEKLQLEGKKPMIAKEFLNGYSFIIGCFFG